MGLSGKTLQKRVSEIIRKIPNNFRCYEITRVLKEKFSKEGLIIEVKDGYALYYFTTFFEEAYKENCELFFKNNTNENEIITAARIVTNLSKRSETKRNLLLRVGVKHSWCILPEEKYLIDYHRSISPELSQFPAFDKFPILKEIEIVKFLIVASMKRLPKGSVYMYNNIVYFEKAVQKNNTVHYTDNDYSVELRL